MPKKAVLSKNRMKRIGRGLLAKPRTNAFIHGLSTPPVPMSASLSPAVLEGVTAAGYVEGKHEAEVLKEMVGRYETETGAKANQTRLIDFIRWWEEREKSS